jgi:hypothetical protein
MHHHANIDGTSAVNALGEVIVFCAEPGFRWQRYQGRGDEIALVNDDENFEHVRIYGRLTIEALEARGDLLVQTIGPNGTPVDFYAVGAARGL